MTTEGANLESGLRERKKQRTRRQIADTARRLFLQRGFDAVTVAEVARASEVAEKTVFNYFPTKEELFYGGMEAFEERLLGAIRDREPGETVLAAFGRFVLAPQGVFALDAAGDDREVTRRVARITRVITESPTLLAREREVIARYTASLAELIAAETGADPEDVEPWVTARALMGVHRSLIDYVRRRTLAGAGAGEIRRGLRAQAKRALALLEHGLGPYAVKGA